MAKKNNEEMTRFTMTNVQLNDKSALKDWDKQVSQMTKALESATNGVVKVTNQIDAFGRAFTFFDVPKQMSGVATKSFDSILANIEARYQYPAGSISLAPYNTIPKTEDYREITFRRDLHGAIAKKTAKEALEPIGASIRADPSKAHADRMAISFPVSESDWQNELARVNGDAVKAKSNLSRRFASANLKDADRYSRDVAENKKAQEEERQQRKEEKEEKTTRRKTLHIIGLIVTALTAIADITRRILTATLARASEIKKESIEAKNVGITYAQTREYRAQERAMGLKEGIFVSALGSLQSSFGDISNLDENALGELAKVLQGDIIEAINNGLGRSNPEKLMQTILNTYYERGQSGINSLGQQVGRYNAERELATALEKAGLSDIAEILRNMFYTNDTGIYKGRIGTEDALADYMALATAYTMGFSKADDRHFSELGAVIDEVKGKFTLLKENLEKLVLTSIGGLIKKIDNWDIGKSESEKADENKTNLQLNQQAKARMEQLSTTSTATANALFAESGIDFSAFGPGATAETAIETLNKNRWQITNLPKNQQEVAKALLQFARTEKGQKAMYSLVTASIAKQKAEGAQKDIEKGRKTGNFEYDKAGYTESAVQSEVQDAVEKMFSDEEKRRKSGNMNILGQSYAIPAIGLLNLSTNGGFAYSSEDMYKRISDEFYGGKHITYEQALASGDSYALTQLLYKKLKGPDAKILSEKKMQNAVKEALKKGELTEDDVYAIQSAHVAEGFGFHKAQREKVRKEMTEADAMSANEQAGYSNILASAVATKTAQSIFAKANADSTVTATVSGFNEKEKTVNVKIELTGKDIKPVSVNVPVNTDSFVPEGESFSVDISKLVTESMTKGVGK